MTNNNKSDDNEPDCDTDVFEGVGLEDLGLEDRDSVPFPFWHALDSQ